MQVQFNKHTLHSANIYQIFTYVKNKEYELREMDHTVSGMLLYAKTDEEIYPNNVYTTSFMFKLSQMFHVAEREPKKRFIVLLL